MTKNSTAGKYPIGYKINHWTFLESPKHQKHKILASAIAAIKKQWTLGIFCKGYPSDVSRVHLKII